MRYFVEPAGTNTGNISTSHWNTPGAVPGYLDATLSHILASSPTNGDEIWALHGTYSFGRPLVINQNPAPLSIYGGFFGNETSLAQRSANIDSTQYPTFFPNSSVLDGGGNNTVMEINADNCIIDGFVIKNGNAQTAAVSDGGGMRVLSSNNIRLENLVIMENTADHHGGGLYLSQSYGHLTNIIFFRNHAIGGGGLYLHRSMDVISQNLLFNGNALHNATGFGSAIYVDNSHYPLFINNTIANNYPVSASVYCTGFVFNVDFRNSILYPDNLVAVGGNVTVDYCLLANNPTGIPPTNVNPSMPPAFIGTNPLFETPVPLSVGGNYRLQTNPIQSPCIDTGNNSYASGTATDLEGQTRILPVGGIVDMGAFEV